MLILRACIRPGVLPQGPVPKAAANSAAANGHVDAVMREGDEDDDEEVHLRVPTGLAHENADVKDADKDHDEELCPCPGLARNSTCQGCHPVVPDLISGKTFRHL